MSSKIEMEKLESENRALSLRLSDVESELSRKENSLKTANLRKSELLSDLREYQRTVKELKAKLERAESAELEAKGAAHDHRLALETAQTSLRDKINSSKAAISSFQLEIQNLKAKLAEKEDKCDNFATILQDKEESLQSLISEKSRAEKEFSSRITSLNQALVQTKQVCAQLTEEKETHKRKEWELAQQLEDLQLTSSQISAKPKSAPYMRTPATPGQGERLFQPACTPGRSIPEESKLGSLLAENKKLKQDLSCLQTNFELTAQKSSQLRSQMKEMESSMSNLQILLDKTISEKEELQSKLKEEHKSQCDTMAVAERKELAGLNQQVEELQCEVNQLQQQNLDLQEKLKSKLDQKLENKALVEKMYAEAKSFKEEKLAMQKEIATLHEELGEVQDKYKELEDSSGEHMEVKKKISAAASALKSKISQLTKEKSEISEQLANASEHLDAVYDKIHLHEEDQRTLEVKLKGKEKEIKILKAKCKDQSHLPGEVEKIKAKVIEMTEEIETLRSKNQDYQAAKERREGQIEELNKMNAKLSRESKHDSELARRMGLELERLEDKVQSLEDDLKAKGKEYDLLCCKMEKTESELLCVANSKVDNEEKMSDLQAKVNELEEKNFELSTEFIKLQKEREIATEANSDMEQKLLEIETKLDAAEFGVLEKDSQISDLKCTSDLMEAENSTLLSQVTSLSEMVSTRNFKIETQQAQILQHESEVVCIMEKITELESEHGGCAKIIDELKQSNDVLKELIEKHDAEKCEMEENISSLKLEIKSMTRSNGVLKATNNDIQDKIRELIAKNDELVQLSHTSENRVEKLEQDLKAESMALKSAQDDLKHAENMHKDTNTEKDEKIATLSSKCTELELQSELFHKERVELKSRVMELQAETKEQAHLCLVLGKERDVLNEQYEQLKESALSVLQSENLMLGDENPSTVSTNKSLRGILKKPSTRKALKPIQDPVD